MLDNDPYEIRAGFLPLLDSAILVAAKENGFARAEGVDLTLIRETSWASIRDRMAVGHFQIAHMLAPMPAGSTGGDLLPGPDGFFDNSVFDPDCVEAYLRAQRPDI